MRSRPGVSEAQPELGLEDGGRGRGRRLRVADGEERKELVLGGPRGRPGS